MTTAPVSAASTIARERSVEPLVLALVLLGTALRLWEWGGGVSLAIGELALARNVLERSLDRLLTVPLAFGQFALPAHLLLLKGATALFGPSDRALRVVPCLASIGALLLGARLARRFLDGWGRVFAVGLLALGIPFIMYAGHLKPFGGMEVAFALVYGVMGVRLLDGDAGPGACLRMGLVGVASAWFAQTALIAAVGVGAALVVDAEGRRDRPRLARVSLTVMLWVASGTAALFVPSVTLDAAAGDGLHDLFALAYMPHVGNVGNVGVVARWLWDSLALAFGDQLFHFVLPPVFVVATMLGAVLLVRAHGRASFVLLFPVVAAVIASAVGYMPFRSYYLLFVCPALLVAVSVTVEWVRVRLAVRAPLAAWGWFVLAAAAPVTALARDLPPYALQETEAVLAGVRAQWKPGDTMYVFFGARQAMLFYGARAGFASGEYTVGGCHLGAARGYLTELDAFRGRPRVWLFVTHDAGRDRARAEMRHYLDEIGIVRDSIIVTRRPMRPFVIGAFAYRYDLSDPTRLARATAATVPLLRPPPIGAIACGWGPISTESP